MPPIGLRWEEDVIDAHSGTTVLASFLASSVECVEALTVVLAVGSVRGWRSALAGAAGALLVLAAKSTPVTGCRVSVAPILSVLSVASK